MASSSLYAAIDLGSNSFHMWLVRHVAGRVQTVAKIKRKVRLASGLDQNNVLSEAAIERGLACLALFAERLQDIPTEHIRVVGTATLRVAVNAADFLVRAKQVLGHDIQVIDGEQEAATIYQGVAYTTSGHGKRLVVDIGGASTELIIGEQTQAKLLNSLKMGCVTWLERYFSDRCLNASNFDTAIAAAKTMLAPVEADYLNLGWDLCVGASGTVQALQEIMMAQGMDEQITLDKLYRLKQLAIENGRLEELDIDGLTLERALVFPSGLAILIAIFERFAIHSMTLAGGALREGLIYGMLPDAKPQNEDNCERTIHQLMTHYCLDNAHANHVAGVASQLLHALSEADQQAIAPLLTSAARVHEIGMTINFKGANQHGAYIIRHSDMPGFSRSQQDFLAQLLARCHEPLQPLDCQHALPPQQAIFCLRLLRLSVILGQRRTYPQSVPAQLCCEQGNWQLTIAQTWLNQHPLIAFELQQEAVRHSDMGWPLSICTSAD
ncbi:Guanosine-5'-triphosphate,3'-diphosphate pyrophosphatase [Vibrio stylophorae]|uniref:Guanosine-5'-triphosphate,3'-diphosphate pyrophosphatase n=1 Tax=Vibrio stylophorae TaxID=659351 RepID=A0ABM8ZPK7_9VIBR|nr:guanosine-5'-triphosphate,3'-diphosphate diphosphatase [Vibrio stylophorae]CAH0532242.1 Guanosine-5'-triphosphate,3'-diphosphate pyrophosphatase [Vibrio stylophorae]